MIGGFNGVDPPNTAMKGNETVIIEKQSKQAFQKYLKLFCRAKTKEDMIFQKNLEQNLQAKFGGKN